MFSSRRRSSNLSSVLILMLLAFTVTLNAQAITNAPKLTGTQPIGASLTKSPPSSKPSQTKQSTQTKSTPAAVPTPDPTSGGLANAPTLYGVAVPSLIVPDTSAAPFMQTSNLPQGTVFICVGAALGFLGACVIAWRGLVVWSLHRSVRRAAAAKYASEKKTHYNGSAPQTGYSTLYHSTNVSMEQLTSGNTAYNGAGGQRLSKTTKPGKRTSSHPANVSSLFYSPTANVAQAGTNRQSSYLPAGYYASGASMPAAGSAIASFGGPAAAGYGRVDNPNSPPTTPGHTRYESTDSRRHHRRSRSRGYDAQDNRVSLHVPHDRSERRNESGRGNGQRAPSAVLDELFEHHTSMRDRD